MSKCIIRTGAWERGLAGVLGADEGEKRNGSQVENATGIPA